MDIVERIKSLCAERGITLNQMEKELGLKGTVARWADHEPSVGKVQMVAQFFGMTVSELIQDQWSELDFSDAWTDEKTESPPPADMGEMDNILQTLRERPDMRVLFKASRKASPDAVMKVAELLKAFEDDETD